MIEPKKILILTHILDHQLLINLINSWTQKIQTGQNRKLVL